MLENSTSTRFVAPQSLSDTEFPATVAQIRVSRNFQRMGNARQTDRRPFAITEMNWEERKYYKVKRWFWAARAEITAIIVCIHRESLRHENLGFHENSSAETFHQPRKSFSVDINPNSEDIDGSFVLMDFQLIIWAREAEKRCYLCRSGGWQDTQKFPQPRTRNYRQGIVKFRAAPTSQTVNAN